MATLLLLLKFLPFLIELVQAIQRKRLTAEATQEMLDDLQMTADYLIARAGEARATVEHTDDAIANDPFNRD